MHVEISRHLAATPDRVFAAFADPRIVERWLTPSPDISLTVQRLEFHEGGMYRFAYHLPDGATVVVGGVYRLIDPPGKIVFSWLIEPPDVHAGIDSEVTVTITATGAGSALVIHHERLTRPDAIARHAEGWRVALDHLITTLEHDPL